jgi:hypothetical protein
VGNPTKPNETARAPTSRKRNSAAHKEQYERFREAARELGTDESEEAFERAFRKIVPPKEPPS